MSVIQTSQKFRRATLVCAMTAILGFVNIFGNDVPNQKSPELREAEGFANRIAAGSANNSHGADFKVRSLQLQIRNLERLLGFIVVGLVVLLALRVRSRSKAKSIRAELEKVKLAAKQDEHRMRCLEQQLADRQKEESVARLVGGVVHEFNNSLTSVVAQAEIGMYYDDIESKNTAFQQIVDVTLQAAELASQLLSYAVSDSVSFGKIDLNQVAVSVQNLMAVIARDRANLVLDLCKLDVFVYANEVQLQQAVVHLVENSIESFSQFQDVKITTGRRQLDRQQLDQAQLGKECSPGRYCFLQVSDQGVGMDEDAICQIFAPVFKSESVGRGLDLATVLAIVRSCRGAIVVESAVDAGTSVTLFLPTFEIDSEAVSR